MGKDDVAAFINSVECTRVISVNTEGTGFKIHENGIKKPGVMLTVGSGDGRVLSFNRYEIVPPLPRSSRFSRTPEYTKIGCGLEREMDELLQKDAQIQIRNWVEFRLG